MRQRKKKVLGALVAGSLIAGAILFILFPRINSEHYTDGVMVFDYYNLLNTGFD